MDFLTTNPDLLVLLGIICSTQLIIFAVFLIPSYKAYRQTEKSKGWRSVTGQILSSEVRERRSSEGGTTSYPVVTYQYNVGLTSYQSDKVSPGMGWGGVDVDKVMARYPAGSTVTVYYDPQNPSDALLERDSKSSITSLLVIMFLINLCICGAGALFAYTS
jgi:hypothetical protein